MFAEKITNDILEIVSDKKISDNVSIFSLSAKDGSVVITIEWSGPDYSEDIQNIFNEIKKFIISTKKEVIEQQPPIVVAFDNVANVVYRFKIWDSEGMYEYNEKLLVSN